MPLYTVQATVRVHADDEREAYSFIRHATDNAKKADIELLDTEVVETELDDTDEPCLPDGTPLFPARKLTRSEREQGMADRGCDTLEEARCER